MLTKTFHSLYERRLLAFYTRVSRSTTNRVSGLAELLEISLTIPITTCMFSQKTPHIVIMDKLFLQTTSASDTARTKDRTDDYADGTGSNACY